MRMPIPLAEIVEAIFVFEGNEVRTLELSDIWKANRATYGGSFALNHMVVDCGLFVATLISCLRRAILRGISGGRSLCLAGMRVLFFPRKAMSRS